jgi:hypothetical protein
MERPPAYWLQRAEKARALAEELHDAGARVAMLDVAAKYNAMAQLAEGREARSRASADTMADTSAPRPGPAKLEPGR